MLLAGMYSIKVKKWILNSKFGNRPLRFPNCPAFRRCLLTRHKCPDFERRRLMFPNVRISNVRFQHSKSGQDCLDFERSGNELTNWFGTGSKPVLVDSDDWNGFRTSERLKSGHKRPDFRRLNWTILSGLRTFGQLTSSEIRR